MPQKLTKTIALFLCFALLYEQCGFAQAIGQVNIAGYFAQMQNQMTDKYRPLHLRYIAYDNQTNNFKLLLDKGDFFKPETNGSDKSDPYRRTAGVSHPVGAPFMAPEDARGTNVGARFIASETTALEQETKKLMEYFYIGLSLPNEAFWVNLRPDIQVSGSDKSDPYRRTAGVSHPVGARFIAPEEPGIIDPELARTDIGKVLLEADVQLKKDTAIATSPETPQGKEYWDKLYKKAEELFGTENITIPTLTRPWIVPNEIIIRESKDNAYIYKATLKVMLEEDYLRTDPRGPQSGPLGSVAGDPRLKILNEYSTQLIREFIIPKLTKEINTAKRYAPLRQVYYSLILAQWFKARFSSSLRDAAKFPLPEEERVRVRGDSGEAISKRINSRDLTSLTSKESWSPETYFQEYQKSFKDGEYNIKLPIYTQFGQSIRSYFSGGMDLGNRITETMRAGVLTGKDGFTPPEKPYLLHANVPSDNPFAVDVTSGVVSASLPVGAVGARFIASEISGSDKSDPYRRTAVVSHPVGAPFMAPAEGARGVSSPVEEGRQRELSLDVLRREILFLEGVEAILARLKYRNMDVRQANAVALKAIIETNVLTPEELKGKVLPAILAGLKDSDWNVRRASVEALKALIETKVLTSEEIREKVLLAILARLNDGDVELLKALIESNILIPEDIKGKVDISAILAGLKDGDSDFRRARTAALKMLMETKVLTPEELRGKVDISAILSGLKDSVVYVCQAHAEALKALIETKVLTPEEIRGKVDISAILSGLKDQNHYVRQANAETLKVLIETKVLTLEEIRGKVDISDILAGLKDRNSDVHRARAAALKALIETKALTPEELRGAVLSAILAGLKDENKYVCLSSAAALKALMETKVLTPEELRGKVDISAILAGLKDGNDYVRQTSATALKALMETKALTPEELRGAVLSAILAGLKDGNNYVRQTSATALKALIETKALTPEELRGAVLSAILAGLKDGDSDFRRARTAALKMLMETKVLTSEELIGKVDISAIPAELRDGSEHVHRTSAEALKALMESKVLTPEELRGKVDISAILYGLKDQNHYVRRANADALKALIESKVLTPEELRGAVLSAILSGLKDENGSVRQANADALKVLIETKVLTSEELIGKVLSVILAGLKDREDNDVRRANADALKALIETKAVSREDFRVILDLLAGLVNPEELCSKGNEAVDILLKALKEHSKNENLRNLWVEALITVVVDIFKDGEAEGRREVFISIIAKLKELGYIDIIRQIRSRITPRDMDTLSMDSESKEFDFSSMRLGEAEAKEALTDLTVFLGWTTVMDKLRSLKTKEGNALFSAEDESQIVKASAEDSPSQELRFGHLMRRLEGKLLCAEFLGEGAIGEVVFDLLNQYAQTRQGLTGDNHLRDLIIEHRQLYLFSQSYRRNLGWKKRYASLDYLLEGTMSDDVLRSRLCWALYNQEARSKDYLVRSKVLEGIATLQSLTPQDVSRLIEAAMVDPSPQVRKQCRMILYQRSVEVNIYMIRKLYEIEVALGQLLSETDKKSNGAKTRERLLHSRLKMVRGLQGEFSADMSLLEYLVRKIGVSPEVFRYLGRRPLSVLSEVGRVIYNQVLYYQVYPAPLDGGDRRFAMRMETITADSGISALEFRQEVDWAVSHSAREALAADEENPYIRQSWQAKSNAEILQVISGLNKTDPQARDFLVRFIIDWSAAEEVMFPAVDRFLEFYGQESLLSIFQAKHLRKDLNDRSWEGIFSYCTNRRESRLAERISYIQRALEARSSQTALVLVEEKPVEIAHYEEEGVGIVERGVEWLKHQARGILPEAQYDESYSPPGIDEDQLRRMREVSGDKSLQAEDALQRQLQEELRYSYRLDALPRDKAEALLKQELLQVTEEYTQGTDSARQEFLGNKALALRELLKAQRLRPGREGSASSPVGAVGARFIAPEISGPDKSGPYGRTAVSHPVGAPFMAPAEGARGASSPAVHAVQTDSGQLWYNRRCAITIPEEEFRQRHAEIESMKDQIVRDLKGKVNIGNIMDFDMEDYLKGIEILKDAVIDDDMNAGKFELSVIRFADVVREDNQYMQGYGSLQGLILRIFSEDEARVITADPIGYAAGIFTEVISAQPFLNANHRIADFIANYILLKNGYPYFMLTAGNVIEYYQLLNTSDLQEAMESKDTERIALLKFKVRDFLFRSEVSQKAPVIFSPASSPVDVQGQSPSGAVPLKPGTVLASSPVGAVGARFIAPAETANGSDKSDPYRRTADVSHPVGAPFMAPAEGAHGASSPAVDSAISGKEDSTIEQLISRIRPAVQADARGIAYLSDLIPRMDDEEVPTDELIGYYQGLMQDKNNYICVYADKIGAVKGYIYAVINEGEAEIAEMVVDLRLRDNHVGTALWTVLMRQMGQRGIKKFSVVALHEAVGKIAQKFGFHFEGNNTYVLDYSTSDAGQLRQRAAGISSPVVPEDSGLNYTELIYGRNIEFSVIVREQVKKVRLAVMGDAEEVTALSRLIPQIDDDLNYRLEISGQGRSKYIWVYQDEEGKIRGYLYVLFRRSEGAAYIAEVAVDPLSQDSKIATALFVVAMKALEETGVKKISFASTKAALKKLGDKFGFAEVRKSWYAADFSKGHSAVPVVSSPVVSQDNGGIDFRALPIVSQAMSSPVSNVWARFMANGPDKSGPYGRIVDVGYPVGAPFMAPAELANGLDKSSPYNNINGEFAQINNLLRAGIIPSPDRIKTVTVWCLQKKDCQQDIGEIISCIADIMRLEEEEPSAGNSAFKDILTCLESDQPAQQIQLSLNTFSHSIIEK